MKLTNQSSKRRVVGYCRVSTDAQADSGVSLDMQAEKIRAMATVHDAELIDVIVDGGESGKSLQRPGIQRLLGMIERREVQLVIIAKLDRLTRSVRDLGELLERFHRRGVALVSVGESLDTGSAAGRLVLPTGESQSGAGLPRLQMDIVTAVRCHNASGMVLREGQVLGPYRVVALAGSGGMGEVWRAHDDRLDRDVALKVVHGSIGNSEARRRLLAEARAVSALNHPNIIIVHDVLSTGDRDVLVMEFMTGDALTQRIPPGGMRPRDALKIRDPRSRSKALSAVPLRTWRQSRRKVVWAIIGRMSSASDCCSTNCSLVSGPSNVPPFQGR